MKAFDLKQNLSDAELNRLIRRLAVVLVIGAIAFTAFYVIDRWKPASAPIVDQQISSLEAAVRTDPNNLSVRGQLADTYLAKGRFADAVTQYDLIIQTGEKLEPAYMGRAQALMGLKRLDDAAKDFQKVVDIAKTGEMAIVDPTLEAAFYGLGQIAMQQDRPKDAVTWLQQALVIKRSDADAIYLLGTAYIATNDLDNAITELRAATVFVPVGWSEPYTAMAQAYTKQGKADLAKWATAMADLNDGRTDAAQTALESITTGDAAVDAAVGLGLLYETKGDNASAIHWYSKALAIDPQNNAARFAMSRIGPLPTAGPSGAASSPSASPAGK
ncbi:MAG TPA: tetratricopeptide repeat protein [Candidatus Limnocylindrales bacterium]|nr:tetratricopeptide repeat protein [Candidatus Limnocylindrales bacterium]